MNNNKSYIKESRRSQAEKWTNEMSEEWDIAINNSVMFSKIYENNCIVRYSNGRIPEFIVENITSEAAVHKYGDNSTVLNFASFKYPGGGFIIGAIAQEEALCHASFLYNVISNKRFDKYYKYNRKHTNNGLYSNFGIYSPDIMFINENNITTANVITVAAPNLSVFNKTSTGSNKTYVEALEQTYLEALESRIKFILDIAENHYTKTLILGAFGCGVFKNDPVVVAKTFRKYLESGCYNFDKVIFAIPEGKDNNYKVFKNIYE